MDGWVVLVSEFVIVCGHRGEKFHEAYQSRTGKWRTMCGTGFDVERLMARWQAIEEGYTPCLRCWEES